jgi:hypothetical protein
MKFRVHLAEHAVQRLRITHAELSAAGVTATFEGVLLPEVWKDALDLHPGDELEVAGPDWRRVLRIVSVGPGGATVESISGHQDEPVERRLFVCRERENAPHLFALYESANGTWRRLSHGQFNLGVLVQEASVLVTREPRPDPTITSRTIDAVKANPLADENAQPYKDASLLCKEGEEAPADRWISCRRGHRGTWTDISNRCHQRDLGERVVRFIKTCSSFAPEEIDLKSFEAPTWSCGPLLVRPKWSARDLAPVCFPKPVAFPVEVEAAAKAMQEKRKAAPPLATRSSKARLRTHSRPFQSCRGALKRFRVLKKASRVNCRYRYSASNSQG